GASYRNRHVRLVSIQEIIIRSRGESIMAHDTSVQPKLADLLTCYLEKQAEAHSAGIATYDHEVTPYEVGPVQPLDPKLAWDEGLAAIGESRQHAPPHWSSLVANHESTVAIAYCAGNFPQLMR